MSITFYKSDCLEKLKQLPDKSINFIYINPPFGTTQNWWDEKLNWKLIFQEYFRLLKEDGMLAIHCSIPFNYELIRTAPKPPSYSWYWKKESPTCALLANHQPLRNTEEILIWKNKKNTYYRQPIGNEKRMREYNPDGNTYYGKTEAKTKTITGKTRTHLLEMKRNIKGFATRPDEMVELMIKSYTKEGDSILDSFCYKGLTGRIAKQLNRKWIGIDKFHFPEEILCPGCR